AILLLVLPLSFSAAAAQENLQHALVCYAGPGGASLEANAVIAQRYRLGITGNSAGSGAQEVKQLRPDFQWYVYNSITDNYVHSTTSNEHALLEDFAAQQGWDPEEGYLHFYDDTVLKLQGDTVSVPGWGGGSAETPAEARVPVYYSNLSRRACHFATPEARQLHLWVVLATTIDMTFAGTDLYPDGIFLDNCAYRLFNCGTLLEGGHVLEAPGQPTIGSSAFQDWHWSSSLGPFLTALKDTLETSASWSPDGQRKHLMINCSNAWSDDYVARDVADVLFLEFEYSPVRDHGSSLLGQAWQRDSLAAAAGIRSFYAPTMTCSRPPYPGEIPYEEALIGGLTWHLATRTEESLLFLFGTSSPNTAGWDTLTWRGCVDVAAEELGTAQGAPYVYAEGTDPLGQNYRVWARDYENGLVLVRNRCRWDEGIEPETAVSLPLPSPMARVAPSGEIGLSTSTVAMRNGTGTILLGTPGAPPDNPPVAEFSATPTAGTVSLAVAFTDLSTNSPTSWAWIFGDGGTSSQCDPSHVYQEPGTYTVSLRATNADGSDTETKLDLITVEPGAVAPLAEFSGTPTSGSTPLTAAFTDLSTNSPTSWAWIFGDGGTSSDPHPSHTYEAAGSYDVSLTVANAHGSDTETKLTYITVTALPAATTADFSGTPRSGEASVTVQFTDLSSAAPTTWAWIFGDGESATAQHPTHTYEGPGTYTVSLTATNAGGTDTETKTAYISVSAAPSAPLAEFHATPTSGSPPLAVKFENLSLNEPTAYSWEFGDGGISTAANPAHTYASAGTYTVSLTATNAAGTDTETKRDYITVTETYPLPVADFSGVPSSGTIPLTVAFNDASTNKPTSWSWDFGDGAAATTANPTHTYSAAATYTVTLTVSNAFGTHTATKIDYITASAELSPPVAAFIGSPTSGSAPLTVHFTDQSSGSAATWFWELGDGATSTLANPTHTYVTAGTYTVSLTAANAAGESTATRTNYISLSEPTAPPVAAFSAEPHSGTAPLTVQFSDQSAGDPSSWAWAFGDGASSTEQHPSHMYSAAGDYTVTLTAANAYGEQTRMAPDYISVSVPPPPQADFAASATSGTAPLTVTFSDLSLNGPTSWFWSFGDQASATSSHPTHIYASPGSYSVSLVAANPHGTDTCTKTEYITVLAQSSAPEADFTAQCTQGIAPLTVPFADASSNDPTAWNWEFGDGEGSSAQNPTHVYQAAGTYTVVLTATNAHGSATRARTAYIRVADAPLPPRAAFGATPATGVAPLAVEFTDQSTQAPQTWSWSFGDGATSAIQHPVHTYTSPGSYTVELTVSNADGVDSDSRTDYIKVLASPAPPVADFSVDPTTGSAPLAVTLTDRSSNSPTDWSWDFGDGDSSAVQSPQHTYEHPGSYSVSVTVSNSEGSTTKTKLDCVIVSARPAPPIADFSAEPSSGHAPLRVRFRDNSTNVPTSWHWNLGNGATSREQNPMCTYEYPGTYSVTLTAANADGSDAVSRSGYICVTAAPVLPAAAFLVDPASGIAPLTVSFTDASTGFPTSWSWRFGDGDSASLGSPTHTYTCAGVYTVTLTVSNADGTDTTSVSECVTVTAALRPPAADFSADPSSGRAPVAVQFTDLSTGAPTAWVWDFGDGNYGHVQHPLHTYELGGTYSITLAVANADGADTTTRTDMIRVMPSRSAPITDLAGTPTDGTTPLTVHFTSLATNEPTSWSWDFGDGGTSIVENPQYTFQTPGFYTITLTTTNAAGSTSETKAGYIAATAAPPDENPFGFAPNQSNPCTPQGRITFSLPYAGEARLELFDLRGRCLSLLAAGHLSGGLHVVPWESKRLSTGVYFLRLTWEARTETKRLTLVK
ncbi:MAG: PKD domain-containing protein, partial [Candidatus Eisenbacteria sp.]|nr:PKD domain-containing protein [Candidatus Eisenbacteria bacterium]